MKISVVIFFSLILLIGCDNPQVVRDGQAIYYQSCVSCHDRGHGGAPVLGDDKAWSLRLSKGKAQLLENLKQGYNSMPAKGACFDCSDQELEMVLEFIILESKLK
ncbi:cytochrome c5 family protein [Kangiella sp. HZ709]|uniref:c-type cytochrome n=1 Tax=Kangiella sp. HZ709 TaxID=2666328 RepID=UPI0012B0C5EB|nr:c-type cytochrome [Kangiella sp. HZ709]MRX27896.1 cytochrome c5 family protein [Kangiella sp. HZ709]